MNTHRRVGFGPKILELRNEALNTLAKNDLLGLKLPNYALKFNTFTPAKSVPVQGNIAARIEGADGNTLIIERETMTRLNFYSQGFRPLSARQLEDVRNRFRELASSTPAGKPIFEVVPMLGSKSKPVTVHEVYSLLFPKEVPLDYLTAGKHHQVAQLRYAQAAHALDGQAAETLAKLAPEVDGYRPFKQGGWTAG